jgi:hypothetical protein
MKKAFITLCSIAALIGMVGGQDAPPATDIYLVELEMANGSIRTIGSPANATDRAAYDNQPFFLPDGKSFLYTAYQEDGQTDICRYDLANRSSQRLTTTSEGEYSPTIMPGGNSFSVIRVESDGTQRLWQFPICGGGPSLVLENVKPVGYHAWGNEKTLVLFVLGDPPTLQIADTGTGKADVILASVGRSLHKIPGKEAFSFVHKVSDGEWWIKRIDMANREVTPLTQTLQGSEDYAWTPDGSIIMGRGAKLYSWKSGGDWQEVADFSKAGIDTVTRIAVSPTGNRLAFVANRSHP